MTIGGIGTKLGRRENMEAGTLVRIFLYFYPNDPPVVRHGIITGPNKDYERAVDGEYFEDSSPHIFTLQDPKQHFDYLGRRVIEVLS